MIELDIEMEQLNKAIGPREYLQRAPKERADKENLLLNVLQKIEGKSIVLLAPSVDIAEFAGFLRGSGFNAIKIPGTKSTVGEVHQIDNFTLATNNKLIGVSTVNSLKNLVGHRRIDVPTTIVNFDTPANFRSYNFVKSIPVSIAAIITFVNDSSPKDITDHFNEKGLKSFLEDGGPINSRTGLEYGTAHLVIDDINSLSDSIRGPQTLIGSMKGNILFTKEKGGEPFFGCYLALEPSEQSCSRKWTCKIEVEFILLCYDQNGKNYIKTVKMEFSNTTLVCGEPAFIKQSELLSEGSQYTSGGKVIITAIMTKPKFLD